jgi:hypothetical protein
MANQTGENDSDEILMLMDYRLRSWLRSACLFPRPFKGKNLLLLASSPFDTLQKPVC